MCSIPLIFCLIGSMHTAFADQLPTDPGKSGDTTLVGIDADADGLRDDVQRFIYLSYEEGIFRNALIHYAKSFQKIFTNTLQPQTCMQINSRINLAFNAVGNASGKMFSLIHYESTRKVRAEFLNNGSRIHRYVNFFKIVNSE